MARVSCGGGLERADERSPAAVLREPVWAREIKRRRRRLYPGVRVASGILRVGGEENVPLENLRRSVGAASASFGLQRFAFAAVIGRTMPGGIAFESGKDGCGNPGPCVCVCVCLEAWLRRHSPLGGSLLYDTEGGALACVSRPRPEPGVSWL